MDGERRGISILKLTMDMFKDSANMKNGPGYFSDIDLKAKKILERDYLRSTKYSIASNSSQVKVKSTSSFTQILPSSRIIASLNFLEPYKNKLAVEYFHECATLGAAVTLNSFPPIDISAVFGTPRINFGGEARYSVFKGTWDKYNVGVSWPMQHSTASFTLLDEGNVVKMSYWHPIGQMKKGAVAGEVMRRIATAESMVTIGCAYVIHPRTLIKAKMNQHGTFGAVVKQEVLPNTIFTISGTFELRALRKTPRIGTALEYEGLNSGFRFSYGV